jgi:NADH-quinone oxidoreductase subunit E
MTDTLIDPKLESVLARFPRGDQSLLIPALQAAQEEFLFLSDDTVKFIAEHLGLSESESFGVASFYAQFRFCKPGDHEVKVCMGTACHARRADLVMETFERELGVKTGETTSDGKYSLERVACFGCCALGPVVVVDEDIHPRVKSTGVRKMLKKYEVQR